MDADVHSLLFMLVVSWNVKGLRCPQKQSCTRDFLKMFCIDIVLLQEFKTTFSSDSFLRLMGDFFITGWSHLNVIGPRGATYKMAGKYL